MKVTIAVCMALLAVVLVQAEDEMAPPVVPAGIRLANGRPAVPRQFPYLAYIEPFIPTGSEWYRCTGSLITRSLVLTAASRCIYGTTNWTVRLGSINREGDDPHAWSVVSVMAMKHPKYIGKREDYNIAIIQLPKLAPVNEFIQPVSLPSSPDNRSYLGRQAIVAGWGETHPSSGPSDVLCWAEVLIVHNDFCKVFATWHDVTDRQLCAGSSRGTVRFEEYGAPLVLYTRGRYTQIGLFSYPTSWEFNTSHPAIYTRVTPYFVDWIKLFTESDL